MGERSDRVSAVSTPLTRLTLSRRAIANLEDEKNCNFNKNIASPGAPDFDRKVQAAIRRKLEAARNSDS
ncbi:hypothetical protein QUA40_06230 [Microcoleus sp. Pol11C3]|uniref:hypothetical protein n=1 Tax=Microcoleus sp. Pol11C3 TaxID=3055390 RepID=UPI002FD113EE